MPLWGATTSDESKPKHLTAEQQKNCYATESGWVVKNGKGLEEVLVAIRGLSGGTSTTAKLGAATINSADWGVTGVTDAITSLIVDVIFNERVDVVTTGGTPSITVSNGDESAAGNGDYTLSYASGTGTNILRFTATGLTFSADDVLTIGAQNIALNSGTIKDADTSVDAGVAIPANSTTITVTAA